MKATIALAYHNLAMMLNAGVPLLRSLTTVAEGLDSRLSTAFRDLADGASHGDTLAQTMAKRPCVFGLLDAMVVRAAETSGSLPEALALLSRWHEFQQSIRKKTLSGMTLPVVLIHAAAILAPLPGSLLGAGGVSSYLAAVVGILSLFYIPAAVIFGIVHFMPSQGTLRTMLDRLTVRIPILGKAVYALALSRYCWVFYMLFKAGLPITKCAEKAASATGNAVVTAQVRGGTASAKAGNQVSDGFSARLPVEFLNIWRVGEETGKLEDVTERLAGNTGQDADFMFTELACWLPRFAYAAVSAVIIYFIFRNFGIITQVVP